MEEIPFAFFIIMASIKAISSAVYNDVQSGLSGYAAVQNMSLEQLEDEVVETRLYFLKQYSLKNIVPRKDLFTAINCITLDCQSMDKCCNDANNFSSKLAHFEIPQIVNDFGEDSVEFIGSTDKQIKFKVYTGANFKYHKYKLRGANKPYVFIDTTPNNNNYYDVFVFNAPLLERLSVIAIFKDPRQVSEYMENHGCCDFQETDNFTWLDTEVKDNLIKKKLYYYRQLIQQPLINDQSPK